MYIFRRKNWGESQCSDHVPSSSKIGVKPQKKTIHASEVASERGQNLRREYWLRIGEVQLSDLVFIDETGVNLAMTRRYRRVKKGKRAYARPT